MTGIIKFGWTGRPLIRVMMLRCSELRSGNRRNPLSGPGYNSGFSLSEPESESTRAADLRPSDSVRHRLVVLVPDDPTRAAAPGGWDRDHH